MLSIQFTWEADYQQMANFLSIFTHPLMEGELK